MALELKMISLIVLSVLVLAPPVYPSVVRVDEPIAMTDADKVESLGAQVMKLKSEMDELVRSFKTLQLIAENPSIIAEMTDMNNNKNNNNNNDNDDSALSRHRRDDGASSNLTVVPGPGSRPQPPAAIRNPYLGPYSYPMFSGQCFLCPAGKEGPRGPQGMQGPAGRDGRDGRDAVSVPDDDVQQSPAAIMTTKSPAAPQPSQSQNKEGAVYTRWGNSVCASGSELVYAGTMAGSLYSHYGSGSTYLCMPSEPIYNETVAGSQGGRGSVFSAEYRTSDASSRLQSSNQHSPTCAVCMAPEGFTSKMMVPGRNKCPSDVWRLEYAGYLMTADNEHKKMEYVCVDSEMEAEPGTQGTQNGALLYMVETECLAGAGLPCGPYVDGYELTCAVCTI